MQKKAINQNLFPPSSKVNQLRKTHSQPKQLNKKTLEIFKNQKKADEQIKREIEEI